MNSENPKLLDRLLKNTPWKPRTHVWGWQTVEQASFAGQPQDVSAGFIDIFKNLLARLGIVSLVSLCQLVPTTGERTRPALSDTTNLGY